MFGVPNLFIFEAIFGIICLHYFYNATQKFPKLKDDLHHKRIPFFDFIKGIAVLSVVFIHSTDLFPETNFLKLVLWFALPLFVFESGYLLAIRHDKEIDSKEYFKHLFFRIFLIYAIFVVWIMRQHFLFKMLYYNLIKILPLVLDPYKLKVI